MTWHKDHVYQIRPETIRNGPSCRMTWLIKYNETALLQSLHQPSCCHLLPTLQEMTLFLLRTASHVWFRELSTDYQKFLSGRKTSLCCRTASHVLFGEQSIHYLKEFPQQSSFIRMAILSLTSLTRLSSLHENFLIGRTGLSNV